MVRKIPTLRSYNPEMKIILSVAQPPSDTDAFTRCCGEAVLREKAAQAVAQAVKDYDLDGVDFDWEYPCVPSNGSEVSPGDKHHFTLFCEAVRNQLDQLPGRHRILSIAAGADVYYVNCVELPELVKYLDYIHVMTYDLKCGFHALAGHHTAPYSNAGDIFRNSCDQALKLFAANGVPAEKLLMGAAFYSRKWTGLKDRNHGLFEIAPGGGGYGPRYDELVDKYIEKNGFVRYWDEEAKAPWLFDGSTFLSYDDPESLKAKAELVKECGYGGIFYWQHGGDSTGELLDTLARELH